MDKISIAITGIMVCICALFVILFMSCNLEYNEQYELTHD